MLIFGNCCKTTLQDRLEAMLHKLEDGCSEACRLVLPKGEPECCEPSITLPNGTEQERND